MIWVQRDDDTTGPIPPMDPFKNASGRQDDNWHDILQEEFFEAMAEDDPVFLRKELIQVAAVVVNWIECIDQARNAT